MSDPRQEFRAVLLHLGMTPEDIGTWFDRMFPAQQTGSDKVTLDNQDAGKWEA